MMDQAAADKRKWNKAVEQPQLAHRIGDINRGIGRGHLAAGTQPRISRSAQHGDVAAALRMTRHHDRQQIGKAFAQRIMRRKNGFLFAGMGLRGEEDGPRADRLPQCRKFLRVCRQNRRVGFQTADHADVRCAQNAKPCGNFLVLGQADIEGRKQCARRMRRPAPAVERALRHARIDQRQTHAALVSRRERGSAKYRNRRTVQPAVSNNPGTAPSPRAYRSARIDGWRRGGNLSLITFAEVTVPLVTITLQPSRVSSASIKGNAATHSPTLAPCTQTSSPCGRACEAKPRRSSDRS